MKYILIISIALNIALFIKIIAMRFSLKELAVDFEERADLDSDTLIGVYSRDKRITELASVLNQTITKLRDSYHLYKRGDENVRNAITNVAHDIRTPLTAICGYLELADKIDKSPELKKYLDIINERALYMKKLTDELFKYSVIMDKESKEEKKNIVINKVLEDSIMSFYPSLIDHGIKPEIDITEVQIKRKLYPSYVERIFNNLISNAIKYSDGDLEISLTEEGLLTVSNSASDLDKVKVEKIFGRFYTVENASASSGGIGLSIVQQFADAMNCPLEADYENGKLVIKIQF